MMSNNIISFKLIIELQVRKNIKINQTIIALSYDESVNCLV